MKKLIIILLLSSCALEKGTYLTIDIYRKNGNVKRKHIYAYSPLCLSKRGVLKDGAKTVFFSGLDSFKVISKSKKRR